MELKLRDCGAIPGRGLLVTVERRTGDVREQIMVGSAWEESRADMEARRYC